ncbi:MAG: Precorrin-3B synthase [Tardiphaga sp.]|nr:Precorrin-3B synthase [Tardiphaga sp.]
MVSGDGLVARVRPRGGRLTPVQAIGLARLAVAHGNGLLDLTSRANIQVRGVTEGGYGPLTEGLAALGLIDPTAEAEAQRNIVVTPYWSSDDDVQTIAATLADALAAPDAPRMPGKFGFSVDCGPSPVLSAISADIRLERGGDGCLLCRADGAVAAARVTAGTAVDAAMKLAHWFLRSGGVSGGRGRMAAHLARGAVLPDRYTEAPVQPSARSMPKPGLVEAGVLLGFEFGQLRAETLSALANHGALRLTPWRMLLIEGLDAAPDLPGLVTRPDDPALRVVACTGAPDCLQGQQPTRALARILTPLLPTFLPQDAVLHVSGCAKGCAHPQPAALTLTAGADGYDLVRGGRPGDAPMRSGLSVEYLTANPATLYVTR